MNNLNKKIICFGLVISVLFCGILITIDFPKAAEIKATKITKCESVEGTKISLSWESISNIDGYQIKVSTNKDFSKVVGTVNTIKKEKTKLAGFTKEKIYYIKIRAFKKTNNNKKYGEWSSVKKVYVHNHDYKLISTTKASCTKIGVKNYKCSCGIKTSKTIAKKEHSYKKIKTTQKTITYKCSNCGYTITKTNPTLDKTYTIKYEDGKTVTVVGHFDSDKANTIFNLTNNYRKKNGLTPLKKGKDSLQNASNTRAYEIVDKFSHYRPNGKRAIITFSDIGCCAENLGRYQKTAKEVVDAWVDSPGHNKNLLKKDAKYLSVGVFAEKQSDGSYYYHYVQLFGN